MLLIRRAEETLLNLFSQGLVSGTTHTSIGQESCSVGVAAALDLEKDIVFSNHRCHGHFLAYGAPVDLLFAEVMGKRSGACAGIGGSQHLHYRNFYSNGIQGGIVPGATGMALAEKLKGLGTITVVFLGDGTFGEGVIYECFNIASLWRLPMLFVVEHNGISQSTPTHAGLAGNLAERPRAFGIETEELEAEGPAAVRDAAARLAAAVRRDSRPHCLFLRTFRLGPHSKGDDTRSKEELALAAERDPLNRMLRLLPTDAIDAARQKVDAHILESLARTQAADELRFDEFMAIAGRQS
ncbi:MAG: thiamine pyrophosphate-dependent dehydrogenase E1 component subunit alpha [Bryobacteraceae bacterium]